MHPTLTALATRKLTRAWHVGTMRPQDKRQDSHEGNGLSICLHPQEWTRIARLGGGSLFELTKSAGEFLEFHKLTPAQRAELQSWALARGWLHTAMRWRAQWHDGDEDSTFFALYGSREEALAELDWLAEDEEPNVREVEVTCLTEKAVTRLGFTMDPLHSLDLATTFFVEDETTLDGVWWNDRLAPASYSAPRGVICLRQLPTWSIKLLRGPQLR